jgi:hypothetical protein
MVQVDPSAAFDNFGRQSRRAVRAFLYKRTQPGLKTSQHLGLDQPCRIGCARILRIRTCVCRANDQGDLVRV